MARSRVKNAKIQAIKRQRTLVLVKPDGVQRMLVGEIIRRFEQAGLKLVGLKLVWADRDLVEKHYRKDEEYLISIGEKTKAGMEKLGIPTEQTPLEIGTFVRNQLGRFLAVGPVVAMVWQGTNAIGNVRQLVGSTDPILADVGTIRGDLTIDTIEMANYEVRSVRNLIHASGDPAEAAREITLWFTEKELYEYENVMDKVLHDADWDRPAARGRNANP